MERTVVGMLTGMEPRNNGWMRFSITEPGKQYPVKTDTKKPEIIQAAQMLMGQMVAAEINEEDSGTPNPHRPGSNFINRYLNGIRNAYAGEQSTGTPLAQTPQPAQQPAAPQPAQPQAPAPAPAQYQQTPWEKQKELRIMRATSIKAAVSQLPYLPAEQQTPKGLIEVAETWMAYQVFGPGRFGVTAFNQPQQAPQQAPPPQQAPQPQQAPPTADGQQTFPAGDPSLPCSNCGGVDAHIPGCDYDIPF